MLFGLYSGATTEGGQVRLPPGFLNQRDFLNRKPMVFRKPFSPSSITAEGVVLDSPATGLVLFRPWLISRDPPQVTDQGADQFVGHVRDAPFAPRHMAAAGNTSWGSGGKQILANRLLKLRTTFIRYMQYKSYILYILYILFILYIRGD